MKTFKTPMTGPGGLAPGMENRDWQPSSHRRNTPVPVRQQQVFQISILFSSHCVCHQEETSLVGELKAQPS